MKTYVEKTLTQIKPTVQIGGALKEFKGGGGVEYAVNVQLIHIPQPSRYNMEHVKPICPKCKGRMGKLGRSGFICKKCKYHIFFSVDVVVGRNYWVSQIILPPYRSIRHLTKPLKRFGREHRQRLKGITNIRWSWLSEPQYIMVRPRQPRK